MQRPIDEVSLDTRMPHAFNRRKFLQFGTGLLTLVSSNPSTLFADRFPHLQQVQKSTHGLGTTITLTALHDETDQAERAIDSAFDELRKLEATLSIYRTDSHISKLNEKGIIHDPDARFIEILRKSVDWSQKTHGAFDITVQPLWSLYQKAKESNTLPDAIDLKRAKASIDWNQLDIQDGMVRLKKQGAAITLNGIAQGYATDRVRSIFREHAIEHALIDCGEIGSLGSNAKGTPWAVGIQHPRQADAYCSIAQSDGRALATSGDYSTSFTSDYRHNHLFDPRTGQSPGELASVTIAAPTATDADAISTALSVMGIQEGMNLIKSLKNIDAFVVTKSGQHLITEGFPCKA